MRDPSFSVVRCSLVKHTACREGECTVINGKRHCPNNCAVQKEVRCLSVCPAVEVGVKNVWVGTNTPDCDDKKLCEGEYTDENGHKQSYGALACSRVAQMA